MCILSESHKPWHSTEHCNMRVWDLHTSKLSVLYSSKHNVWEMSEFLKTWMRCYLAETEQAMALMAVLPPSISLQRASKLCHGEQPTQWYAKTIFDVFIGFVRAQWTLLGPQGLTGWPLKEPAYKSENNEPLPLCQVHFKIQDMAPWSRRGRWPRHSTVSSDLKASDTQSVNK